MASLSVAADRQENPERHFVAESQPWHGYAIYYEILSRHASLTIHDREALAALQEAPKRVKKGDVIKNHARNAKYLLALQDGWACSRRIAQNGHRQIIDLYLPGDIVGLRDYHGGSRFDEVAMLTEGLIIPFQKQKLDEMMRKDHHFVQGVLATAMHQSNIMADRLNNLISHDATARLAYFILELHARLNFSHPEVMNLALPLSQQVVGDLLGMTNVHVCRCLSHLESKGLLIRDKNSHDIRISNYTALLALAGFNTAYAYSLNPRGPVPKRPQPH